MTVAYVEFDMLYEGRRQRIYVNPGAVDYVMEYGALNRVMPNGELWTELHFGKDKILVHGPVADVLSRLHR